MTEFFFWVAEMPAFNFLTCKSIFHLSEHHKFEYCLQPCWDIQVCEIYNLGRDESAVGSIEILDGPYMKPGMKMTDMKLKKVILPCVQIYLNV